MAIDTIYIIHHSHSDFGYTDHPLRARQLQKEYVGQALEHVLAAKDNRPGERFTWTAETLLPVWDWWQQAVPGERKRLLEAVDTGSFEVTGLPFNVTAFLNREEWEHMLCWIPDDLWVRFGITTAMQNDVNGLCTAGIAMALEKGIRRLWIGPNAYNGGTPFPASSAFRWMLPGGKSLFVWLNNGYCDAYYLFNENWRQGPVPNYSDLRYRMPDACDIFRTGEQWMEKAHKACTRAIADIPGVGGVLAVALTNQWRIDNDPPFPSIVDFVRRWNELNLKPILKLATASQAMEVIERAAGANLSEHTGEWVDWWANGSASTPVEMAISRKAKRVLHAASSNAFGLMDDEDHAKRNDILYHLCMYDEHTYGAWESVANPYTATTRMQRAEKDIWSYRSLDKAECLLAERARRHFPDLPDGIHVINPSGCSMNAWVRLPSDCLRGSYNRVRDKSGKRLPLIYEDGPVNFVRPQSANDFNDENVSRTFVDSGQGQTVRFRAEGIPPYERVRYELERADAESWAQPGSAEPAISLDSLGWPAAIRYEEYGKNIVKLIEGHAASFLSLSATGFAPRWTFKDIFTTVDADKRAVMRREMLRVTEAEYGQTIRQESQHDITFTQNFRHQSLEWGKRMLTISKRECRARLAVRICRKHSAEPEVFYIRFDLPCRGVIPTVSNAGGVFKPGVGQLPGSCMDYYAIDGWACYGMNEGSLLFLSLDAPLVTFGQPNAAARLSNLPEDAHVLLSMVFDNTWDTNFMADAHGIMEFRYDIAWDGVAGPEDPGAWSEALAAEPVVIVRTRD